MAVVESPNGVDLLQRSASPIAALNSTDGSGGSHAATSDASSESSNVSPHGEPSIDASQAASAKHEAEPTIQVADLHKQIQIIQEQLENERAQRRMMAERAMGPSGMGGASWSRPWLYEWDMFRPETYSDQNSKSYYMSRVTEPIVTDMAQVHERKRIMMGVVEAELKWLKNEDDAYTTMVKEKEDLKTENTQLTERLTMMEAQVRQWDPNLLSEKKPTKHSKATEKKGGSENNEDDEDDSSVKFQQWPTAQLNRVEWASFSAPYHQVKETFAIDVLEGEPVISFMSYYRPWWTMKKSVSEETKAPAAKKRLAPPGQGPMPERIRINSRQILKILQKLEPDNFTDEDESLIMIRPFKALVFFEDQLRQIHQVLLEKHRGAQSKSPEAKKDEETAGSGEKEARPSSPTAADRPEENREGEENQGNPVSEVLKDEFTSSETALEQLQVLINFLDVDVKAKMDYVRSEQCHRVSFADVWYLFRPGDEVVDQVGKQAYRVIGVTSSPHKVMSPYRNWETSSKDEPTVMLQCVHIDFDGKYLGPVLQTFRIARFDGEKAITSLRVFPIRLAGTRAGDLTSSVDVRQKLIARGKMFIDVLTKKHMHYSGLTLETRDEVDGQVVIDFEKAFESEDKSKQPAELGDNNGGDGGEEELEKVWRPKIRSLISIEVPDNPASDCTAACCARERVHKDLYAEQKRNEHYRNSLIPEELSQQPSAAIYPRVKNSRASDDALSDDDFVIMSYRVFGFSLRSRKWEKLDLTHLSYIRGIRVESKGEDQGKPQVRETAFDQLVLEEGHKKMLLSLVAQHYRDKESPTAANEQVDIVRGKGKGLIILLHGAPGVGKTTTAEGVAELFEKPLFQITCGDLGTTAESVEHALETNFALAHRWGCILLLDEADVFLAKRTPQDFKRNGLVSVFLRVLEYYAGILFLTTNRIGDFDEAFGSRIHISLHYPQLTLPATREIFLLNMRLIQQRFTEKKRNITVDRDAILAMVEKYWKTHKKMRWNGRQIRNACQTALALAEFEAGGGSHEKIIDPTAEVRLSVTHLETVSKAYLEFMQYLRKLYKVDQDRLAQRRGVRARELDDKKMNFTDDEEE
ncbi:ATP-binding protein, partial [Aspergillus brunneoviolaceus CBS 621.78]